MKLAYIVGLGVLATTAAQQYNFAQENGDKKSEPRIVKRILKVGFAIQEIAPPNLVGVDEGVVVRTLSSAK